MNRRHVLALLGSTIPLAGCTSTETPTSHEGTSDESKSETAESSTPTAPTTSPGRSKPEDYLPVPGDDWRRDGTGDHGWHPLGGTDGVRGYYTGPDGGSYEVLVMFSDSSVEGSAESWACAGWQIALAVNGVAMAASTGTDQRTFTPEKPPTMTQTPASGREDVVHELLALSPKLTAEDVDEHRVPCSR